MSLVFFNFQGSNIQNYQVSRNLAHFPIFHLFRDDSCLFVDCCLFLFERNKEKTLKIQINNENNSNMRL